MDVDIIRDVLTFRFSPGELPPLPCAMGETGLAPGTSCFRDGTGTFAQTPPHPAKRLEHTQLQPPGDVNIFNVKSPKYNVFNKLAVQPCRAHKVTVLLCCVHPTDPQKFLWKLFHVHDENLSSSLILTSKYSKGLLLCSKFYSQKEILNRSLLSGEFWR